jgi:predicted transcriptional regulator
MRRAVVGVRLEPELHEVLSAIAAAEGRSLSNTIRFVLSQGIAAREAAARRGAGVATRILAGENIHA